MRTKLVDEVMARLTRLHDSRHAMHISDATQIAASCRPSPLLRKLIAIEVMIEVERQVGITDADLRELWEILRNG